MNAPLEMSKRAAGDSSNAFNRRNAIAAFLSGSILVSAACFGAVWVFLGVRPDGSGNLGFWSAILSSATIGAFIAGRRAHLSALAAGAIGVASVFTAAVVVAAAIVVWAVSTGAV